MSANFYSRARHKTKLLFVALTHPAVLCMLFKTKLCLDNSDCHELNELADTFEAMVLWIRQSRADVKLVPVGSRAMLAFEFLISRFALVDHLSDPRFVSQLQRRRIVVINVTTWVVEAIDCPDE